MKIGSGSEGELTFLDFISMMSFLIALENLDLNVTQEDAQNLQKELNAKTDLLLKEIHAHLEEQDDKINRILEAVYHERNF
jgi:hypothetical protein